jgi:hypothetical protein
MCRKLLCANQKSFPKEASKGKVRCIAGGWLTSWRGCAGWRGGKHGGCIGVRARGVGGPVLSRARLTSQTSTKHFDELGVVAHIGRG